LQQPNSPSRATLSVLLSVVFLDNLGFAIVVPYLYFYIQSLGGDTLLYGVLLAAYSLMSFVTTPIVARLSDRYGRRKILLAGLAVASFSYFLFGAAQVLWLLFLGRMLSGTTAATVPVAQAYVADVTTKQQRLRYMGLLGAAAGLAFIFGPAIGGTLSSMFGYAVPSFLASALALGNFISAYFLLPEPASFNTKRTVVTFRALLGALRQRKMELLLGIYFLFTAAFVFVQSTLSPWLQTVFGFGAFQTGLVFFFVGAISVFVQVAILPVLSKRLDRVSLTALALGLFTLGLVIFSVISSLPVFLASALLFAFGFGIQYATLNTLISLNSPENAQGGALGIAWAIAGGAQSIAPVLAASAFNFGIGVGFVGLAFLVAALICVANLGVVWFFRKTSPQ
jgi:multidrug resistance protein